MSEFRLSFPAWLLAGRNRLSAEDVLTLRRVSFPDGIRSSEDVALLLSIHHSSVEKCDEWDGFYIGELADFIVHHSQPQGTLDDANAAWLIEAISTDGIIRSPTDFEVLLAVLDIASHVPPVFAAFAIDQLRYAVVAGTGAYSQVRSVDSRGVTRHDVEFIRHVLRNSVDAGGIALAPLEIQALDRIAVATERQVHHADWLQLRKTVRAKWHESGPRIRWLRVSDEMLAEGNTEAAA